MRGQNEALLRGRIIQISQQTIERWQDYVTNFLHTRGRELQNLKRLIIRGGSFNRPIAAAGFLENLDTFKVLDELVYDNLEVSQSLSELL